MCCSWAQVEQEQAETLAVAAVDKFYLLLPYIFLLVHTLQLLLLVVLMLPLMVLRVELHHLLELFLLAVAVVAVLHL
jgi:hypothetical protein